MAILQLHREPGGNSKYRPWYRLSLEEYNFEKLFCAKDFQKLFPDVKLEPGEFRSVEVSIKFIEKK